MLEKSLNYYWIVKRQECFIFNWMWPGWDCLSILPCPKRQLPYGCLPTKGFGFDCEFSEFLEVRDGNSLRSSGGGAVSPKLLLSPIIELAPLELAP